MTTNRKWTKPPSEYYSNQLEVAENDIIVVEAPYSGIVDIGLVKLDHEERRYIWFTNLEESCTVPLGGKWTVSTYLEFLLDGSMYYTAIERKVRKATAEEVAYAALAGYL